MKSIVTWMVFFCIMPGFGWAEKAWHSGYKGKKIQDVIVADYKQFYSTKALGRLTIGLGGAGILAHTKGDPEIQTWYQDSIRSRRTDDISRVVKTFGSGKMTIPIFAGTALIGRFVEDTAIGSLSEEWATRSLRTVFVGAPPLLFLQKALGSSRPNEANSHWHPFEDDNGVSGHSFMGAVPFLSAAMMAENRYFKMLFYTGSTFCGLSRINDDKHYLSQVALGWWLAYLAARSVHNTEVQRKGLCITPLVLNDGIGVRVSIVF